MAGERDPHELGDAFQVKPSRRSLSTPSLLGQPDQHPSPVLVVVPAIDPAQTDEPVDQPGRRRTTDQNVVGQLAHGERLAGPPKLEENVVLVQAHAGAGPQFRVEPRDEVPVRHQQGGPGAQGVGVRILHTWNSFTWTWLHAARANEHAAPERSHTMSTTLEIRRAATRPRTKLGWLDSSHSFSFGGHYDPANTHHGLLLVSNDDRVAAGTGFSTHPHRDMEIVTWVLSGRLEHKDSEGNTGELYPGLAQRMSAGTGIWHSEMNPSSTEEVHFVQMWVLPDTERVDPGYEQLDINGELDRGGLQVIASGKGDDAAISIRQRDAVLWGGRLKANESAAVPDGGHAHLFVATGALDLETAGSLGEGDAARLASAGEPRITAGPDGAEILIWVTA